MPADGTEATRHMVDELAQEIRVLTAGGPRGDDAAVDLFGKIRRLVSRTTPGNASELLGPLEPKVPVLRFLIDFSEQKKVYKRQAVDLLAKLLKVPEWREALDKDCDLRSALPHDVRVALGEAEPTSSPPKSKASDARPSVAASVVSQPDDEPEVYYSNDMDIELPKANLPVKPAAAAEAPPAWDQADLWKDDPTDEPAKAPAKVVRPPVGAPPKVKPAAKPAAAAEAPPAWVEDPAELWKDDPADEPPKAPAKVVRPSDEAPPKEGGDGTNPPKAEKPRRELFGFRRGVKRVVFGAS